ncbi:alpha-glucan family phosphorylase [Carboxylicivirga sp. N1Y90]|uniref:alpha-glucan family phosphorylase n=1 Tax=Carboxylicivirga fragile TaxID=3417571 RepID=UPI003D327CA4|nr:alpha-glucan family phosphorylase [Marinilabiliaceae bacterium N1Y90]
MISSFLKPDYVFETSWEVCNKMGGIHTVLATKAQTLVQEFQDKVIFIGPDVWRGSTTNPEFIQDIKLFADWREELAQEGISVRIGRWKIVGEPVVVLVDFTPFVQMKDDILAKYWEWFKVDSLSGQWDYIESVLFGYASGKVVESFYRFKLGLNDKVVAHYNEWMTGSGALYLNKALPQVGTIFTTHATVIGRSLAGNGYAFYDSLSDFDGDAKAQDLHVEAKHSMEKQTALNVDCFTTVSEITARECQQFHGRQIDVVTPNGFEEDFVPKGKLFDERRKIARDKLKAVAQALLGYELKPDTVFVANSGRYEYKNKGIDVFMDALKELNEPNVIDRDVVAFVLIPANTYGPRKDLIDKLENPDNNDVLENPFLTHGLNDIGYDPIINKIQDIHLNNEQADRVKLIFVPAYLNNDDGIFDIPYYDVLIGMDLTVFPSYYEPWGYTPVESLAFQIPTITTSLAGFGLWAKQFSKGINDGVEVLHRNDDNHMEVAHGVSEVIQKFIHLSDDDIKIVRAKSQQLAQTVQWNTLIKHYFSAYDMALKAVSNRKDNLSPVLKEARVRIKPQPSVQPIWKKIIVKSKLPERLAVLHELSHNLWWSWNYQAADLYEEIDEELWIEVKKNPMLLLDKVSYERLHELAEDESYIKKVDKVYAMFQAYMKRPFTDGPSISYFSMEYGINDILKIYSGGLGVLAGDYLKEASDCAVNMVAVGLLYRYGYFKQSLSLKGEQMALYDAQEFSNLPLEEVRNEDGTSVEVEINMPGRTVYAKVWKAMVGRIPLYLLDTDVQNNNQADKDITHSLYGGDWENRLKQEILLGMGGIRMLNHLKIRNEIYHCNEGHAALINIQRMLDLMGCKFTYQEAMELVRGSSLFTTHTPVPAGHDKFDEDLLRIYLRHVPEKLMISWDDFMDLGRENPGDKHEKFSMSNLAAKTSQEMNGVSWLHGEVSKDMFQNMWKGFYPKELHIGYVTNGVHYGTWTAKDMRKFYESQFDDDFMSDLANKSYWEHIQSISDSKIWNIRLGLKTKLMDYIKDRTNENMATIHADPATVYEVLERLDDKALTIGFARRFATYKRAHLLFTDTERLAKIVNNPDRPVQFIFAGKAHPADGGGQALIKHIVEISRRPEFIGKIVFLENYDMDLAKRLVSGVDVWMNTPTRPLEASGTSGQKAEMNGVLNFSVLDGWWYEGYREQAGWALTDKRTYKNQDYQDELDAAIIYSILENDLIPDYYNQDEDGLSKTWLQYIKNSIARIAPDYTTKRMMDDYRSKFYNPLQKRFKSLVADDYKLARDLAAWKRRVLVGWDAVEVLDMEVPDIGKQELGIGDAYHIRVVVDLKQLADIDLGLEMVVADAGEDEASTMVHTEPFEKVKVEGTKVHFELNHVLNLPGVFKFGVRMFPHHEKLPHKQDFGVMRWL